MGQDKPIPKGFDSHPYIVQSIRQCSDEIRTRAQQYLLPGDVINDIYVVPRTTRPVRFSSPRFQPEHVLFFTNNGVLSVQESDLKGEFPPAVYINANEMTFLRSNLILLFGKLEIVGATGDKQQNICMEFNTIRYELLKQAIHRFLFPPITENQLSDDEKEMEKEAWNKFESLDIKFKNGLSRYSLGANEHLLGFVFQPTIYMPVISGLRLKLAFSTLLAISQRYLITIGEGKAYQQTAYGWVITCYPLAYIDHIDFTHGQLYNKLAIHIRNKNIETRHVVKMEKAQGEQFMKMWASRKTG